MNFKRSLIRYGIVGSFYILLCYFYTKLFFINAKLIRLPIDIRNKKNITFGNGFTTGKNCRLEVELKTFSKNKILIIGDNVQINDFVHITASSKVFIGNNVLIASKVYISDTSHGAYKGYDISSPFQAPDKRDIFSIPVIIEDNVWIGDGVCILPGVTIGFGSIIGANSVVTKDVDSLSIYAGIPAKKIKFFNKITNLWENT
jgi:acetyltransferase-like isoleucine patch superfamily enzyme